MVKAYEVMTKSLAICHPDDNAALAAGLMKDRDIGNVLVVEDGQLRGIVTDRDLVVNGLANDDNLLDSPVSKYMSSDVITGEADWSLNKIARTMARHQIRRLPILQHGQVAGIISLGDIARQYDRKGTVSDSLKEISEPNGITTRIRNGHLGSWLGLSALALTSGLMAWLTWSHSGQQLKKQVIRSKPYYSATQAVNIAREKVNDAATSKKARNLRRQVKSNLEVAKEKVNDAATSKTARNLRKQVKANLKELYSQLPTIEYKPSRHKFTFFR